jgi:hypothetical protein
MALGCLSATLALFVQFAPTIHSLTPHETEPSCNHVGAKLHFESLADGHVAPCLVCAHVTGGHGSLPAVSQQIEEIRSVRSSAPFIQLSPEPCLPDLPDSRGPPRTT